MSDRQETRERLIERLERLAAEKGMDAAWCQPYFETATQDTLDERSADALTRCLQSSLHLAANRVAGQTLVRVCPPEASDGLSRVSVCCDDMPFLLDTLMIAVRRFGVLVDWTLHPVLGISRGSDGQLQGLGQGAQALTEAWIELEFEALANAEEYSQLEQVVREHLSQVRLVVEDFGAMRRRLKQVTDSLMHSPASSDSARLERVEAAEFLRWLDDGHFTMLALAETRFEYDFEGRARSVPQPEAALGLSREGQCCSDIDSVIAPREELDKYAESPRVVVLTKAAQRSTVHHAEYMDHIAVRYYGDDGRVAGILRIIGLYSSEAYVERPWDIPMIRRRIDQVMQRSRLRAGSHSAKNLREILHGLPREELFQYGENELLETCMGIRALRDRHPLRLFLRRDRYGRFFSALVYLPRERFSRELRDRIAQELKSLCGGHSVERRIEFLRGGLTRVRALVLTPPGTELTHSVEQIEQQLRRIARPWRDQLFDALKDAGHADATALATRFGTAFSAAYADQSDASVAAQDVAQLAQLVDQRRMIPKLFDSNKGEPHRLKLYVLGQPRALADILPILENLGVRAIWQDPERVRPGAGGSESELWIQDFAVELYDGTVEDRRTEFEEALVAVSEGRAEDDSLNRLVLSAGLDVREVACIRALARYVNQMGLPFGRSEIERQVALHPGVAASLMEAFYERFDPSLTQAERQDSQEAALERLSAGIDRVESLDADRILRALASVISATLRTNYFQQDANGRPRPVISFKLDPSKIPELPAPWPAFEIWVCSPDVEGVHLRGGRVARGGLRWSDRREDFRTEVLGLMKAQQVKNAVIVPVGAKGGFVVKRGPTPDQREAWFAHGRSCYQDFLRGLLDVTDNRQGEQVIPPPQLVRYDADDPYLVVAADKGTATFSDVANEVAAEFDFWLGDAFASGGSAGYDHKKMGITARSAWESVKRHFLELGFDTQSQDFTVIGVGDMSGDVFGNGMLLSPHIRLVAAFDHRHIFVDPNPDASSSFEERKRLFDLPRSSWADYDRAKISDGGGVFSRSEKRIALSSQLKAVLGVCEEQLSPNQLIQAILKAPVDLLWNGGIGTYVKASQESQEAARDRANDGVRVNGKDLRARVVAEGGNLGLTQAGRIEFSRLGAGGKGGRINTDAIDNAGGVNSSDREVNIKIPLNQLMREGAIDRPARDQLLSAMTENLIEDVLRDSRHQAVGISLTASQAAQRLGEHSELIKLFERQGRLDRSLEGLPDDEEIHDRRSTGVGLQRPEIAVLVAYSKNLLFEAAAASSLAEDPFFDAAVLRYFPEDLQKKFASRLLSHDLKKEIVATVSANAVVNKLGPAFAHRLAQDHGLGLDQVIKACAAADAIVDGTVSWRALTQAELPPAKTYELVQRGSALARHVAAGLVADQRIRHRSVADLLTQYRDAFDRLEQSLDEVLPETYLQEHRDQLERLQADGLSPVMALRLARTRTLCSAVDIIDLSSQTGTELLKAAEVYFRLGEALRLPWILDSIVSLRPASALEALARTRLRDDAYRLHGEIAAAVLQAPSAEPDDLVAGWLDARSDRLRLMQSRLADLQNEIEIDYPGLAVAVRELQDLRSLAG